MRALTLLLAVLVHTTSFSALAKNCLESGGGFLAKTLQKLEQRTLNGKKYDPETKFKTHQNEKGLSIKKCGGTAKYIPDVDLKGLYWVADTAGHGNAFSSSGGCGWKLYRLTDGVMEFQFCADDKGKPIVNKHESNSGKSMPCK